MSRGASRSTERIRTLVVDDDSDLIDLTEAFLEREALISVETATSATAALDRLRMGGIDCVVSDYKMPEVDGLEFLDRIRNELGSTVPFIIFTGNSREEVAITALNLGANRYIQKGGDPVTQFELLADAVEQEVDHDRKASMTREYERRLELAQEIANFGVIDWDLTTDEVYCSDELREMFGLPTDRPLSIEDIEGVMHPEDAAEIQQALESAIAGESEYVLSHRIKRPDGTVLWTKNQARLIRDESGAPVRLLGIAVDVTAERQAQPLDSESR